jgi:hypothetical protein
MAVGSAQRANSLGPVGLVVAWLLLASAPAAALEAFDGRIQAHGFVEMQVRGISEKYGLNGDELDLAMWYNVLNVEFEFDILPDGFGPIDLLSAFVRVEARYDCIYTHGCEMFDGVNTFGNRHQRLPKRLRNAQEPDYAGVIKVGDPVDKIQNQTAAKLEGLRQTETFGPLRLAEPIGPIDPADDPGLILVDDVHVVIDPVGRIVREVDGEIVRYSLDASSPLTIDDVFFSPKLHRRYWFYPRDDKDTSPPTSPPSIPLRHGENSGPIAGFLACDPEKECPGDPFGRVMPPEINPTYHDTVVEKTGFGFDTFFDLTGADLIANTADDPGLYVFGEYADYRWGLKKVRGAAGGSGTTQFIGPWLPENTIHPRAVLSHKANPLRGAKTQSIYTSTGTANRRFYTRSQDLAGLNPSPMRDLLWLGDSPQDGYTDLVDPFPAELDHFWDTLAATTTASFPAGHRNELRSRSSKTTARSCRRRSTASRRAPAAFPSATSASPAVKGSFPCDRRPTAATSSPTSTPATPRACTFRAPGCWPTWKAAATSTTTTSTSTRATGNGTAARASGTTKS